MPRHLGLMLCGAKLQSFGSGKPQMSGHSGYALRIPFDGPPLPNPQSLRPVATGWRPQGFIQGPLLKGIRTGPVQYPNIWVYSTQPPVGCCLLLVKPKYWDTFLGRFTARPFTNPPPSPASCRNRVEAVRVYSRSSVKRDSQRISAVRQYLGLFHSTPCWLLPPFGQTQILGHIPRQVYRGP